jgi:hypothetical protein
MANIWQFAPGTCWRSAALDILLAGIAGHIEQAPDKVRLRCLAATRQLALARQFVQRSHGPAGALGEE